MGYIRKDNAVDKRDAKSGIEDSSVKVIEQRPARYVPLGCGIWIREDAIRKKTLGAAA